MPRPDWAVTTTISISPGVQRSSAEWATEIFDIRAVPRWVKALFAARAVIAAPLHLAPGNPAMFAIDAVVGADAVIDTDDRHLRFVAGMRAEPGLGPVATLVTLKSLRGRLHSSPCGCFTTS